MKKVGYALITIIEVLLIVGAYLVQDFAKKKMGMIRYVIYKNQIWEQRYPLETWKNASVIVLILMAVAVLVLLIRKRDALSGWQLGMGVVMLVLTAGSVGFTLKSSVEIFRAYYFVSPMLAIAALLQTIKVGAALLINGGKHGTEQ